MPLTYPDHRLTRRVPQATSGRPADDDPRLERLIRRLPENRQGPIRWLRSPDARWARVPLGVSLVLGSFLFILPMFGLWMLPAGVLLLAEDVMALRRVRTHVLNWIERRRPHWFSEWPE